MKRYIRSSRSFQTLEQWCSDLSPRIKTLYLHEITGQIIGKLSVDDAIAEYGDHEVTNSYTDSASQISVWIM